MHQRPTTSRFDLYHVNGGMSGVLSTNLINNQLWGSRQVKPDIPIAVSTKIQSGVSDLEIEKFYLLRHLWHQKRLKMELFVSCSYFYRSSMACFFIMLPLILSLYKSITKARLTLSCSIQRTISPLSVAKRVSYLHLSK